MGNDSYLVSIQVSYSQDRQEWDVVFEAPVFECSGTLHMKNVSRLLDAIGSIQSQINLMKGPSPQAR